MPQVAAITGAMSFDFSPYMHGMMQVQSITALFPQCVTNFIANPLLGLVGIFKDASRTIAGWVGTLAEGADSADELAVSLGVNVEFLTAYGRAASLAGSSLQDVGQAFQFLNLAIADAAAGGSKAQVFADLGVSFRNSAGGILTAEQAILDVGEAIRNTADAAKRTDLARELFGRGAGPMITTFMEGKESIERSMNTARRVGAVTTQEEAQNAAKFLDTAQKISWAWEGVKKSLTFRITEGLLPHLEKLLDWMEKNPDLMRAKMEHFADGIVLAFDRISGAVEGLLNNFDLVSKGMTTLTGAVVGFKIGGPWGALFGGIAGYAIGDQATRAPNPLAQHQVTIQNLNVQAPPLDQATTTRIAERLQAPLREGMRQQQTQWDGQFKAASMAGGI